MLKPAMVALAAALTLTAGSMVPTAASAQPYGGPGWGAPHHGPGWGHGPQRICRPVFRTVRVHGPHGWRAKVVRVGERCYGRPGHHR